MIKVIIMCALGLGSIAYADKDRGAGSGYRGRPLESYVKDINQFKEFTTIVKPALDRLGKKVPQLAEDLMRVAHLKNWFFVPVRLPEIPPDRIGVTFKTDLYALQSISEIWFDDELYRGMTDDAYRAMILTHELAMGLKLSSLYKDNPYCDAKNYSNSCRLTESDYASVRGLAVIILNTQNKLTDIDIKKFLKDNNFGAYNSNNELKHLGTFDIAQLYLLLISEQKTQALPTIGRDGTGYDCAFNFSIAPDYSALEVKIYYTQNKAALRDYPPLKVLMQSSPKIVVQNGKASFQYATPVNNPGFGSYRRKLEIFINPDRVTRINAYWEVYVYDYRSKDGWGWAKETKGPLGEFEPAQRICEY